MLEYLRGGQLYDSLHRLAGSEEPYTEQSAAAIFAQASGQRMPPSIIRAAQCSVAMKNILPHHTANILLLFRCKTIVLCSLAAHRCRASLLEAPAHGHLTEALAFLHGQASPPQHQGQSPAVL